MPQPRSLRATLKRLAMAPAVVLIAMAAARTSEAARGSSTENVTPTGSKAETANFTAEIAANGSYKSGSEGTVKVTLVATGGYHINPQYPYKFKTASAPEGLTYPKQVLQRADGTFEETRATFLVPFVAAKAGKATVGGTLHLSVCSAANCIVEKVPLEVAVDVK